MMIRKHGERGFDSHKYRRKVKNFETMVLPVHFLIYKRDGMREKEMFYPIRTQLHPIYFFSRILKKLFIRTT